MTFPTPYYRLGLLGHPLGHTLSPPLHQWMLAQQKLQGFYVPLDTPHCAKAMRALHTLGFHGLNVTVPHKLAALKNSVQQSETARLIGAANTLCWQQDGWAAHNTDGEGLLLSLKETFGPNAPKSALVIGAGGAARGVLWALAAWGAHEVMVLNRTTKNARALAPLAQKLGLGFESGALTGQTPLLAPLVIQTTTVGMSPDTGRIPTTLPFTPKTKVVDLIYRPRPTLFLQQAAAQGAKTLDGLPMLAYQAWLAFGLWTGTKPSRKALLKKALSLLPPS